jgi:hypothetical protein
MSRLRRAFRFNQTIPYRAMQLRVRWYNFRSTFRH